MVRPAPPPPTSISRESDLDYESLLFVMADALVALGDAIATGPIRAR